jgi:hypothetical protein
MRWKLAALVCLFFMFSFVSAVIPQDCNDNLVSYWKFDVDASDSIGSNGGDSLSTGASLSSSKQKVIKSLSLVGTGAKVKIPRSGDLEPSEFSIEIWFNFASFLQDTMILNKLGDYQIYANYEAPRNISAKIFGQTLISNITASADEWYFVTLAFDGSLAKLYVNGVEKDSTTISSPSYTSSDLLLGIDEQAFADYGESFIGYIDELAFYNKSLSQAEINTHYALSNSGHDYCYVPVGSGGSTTGVIFNIAGCSVNNQQVPVGSCSRDGSIFCKEANLALDTTRAGNACKFSGTRDDKVCCPENFICEEDEDDNKYYCNQRTDPCGENTDEPSCDEDDCYWINNKCRDPQDSSLSCSIYKNNRSCEEDRWNLARIGADTDRCGTFTPKGKVIPESSCKCSWNFGNNKCAFNYTSIDEIYSGLPETFNCLKYFETGICDELSGQQAINWTTLAEPTPSIGNYDPALLEDAGCMDGNAMRNCGQAIVNLPGFSIINVISVILLLSTFYAIKRKD